LLSQLKIEEKDMKDKVEKALEKVRVMLEAEGGNVDLVDVSADGVVKVRLTGACGCCPMSQMTLKMGIERVLKQEVPQIKEVVAV
jgi:Fe-S cluster biogenesis protein NfuA